MENGGPQAKDKSFVAEESHEENRRREEQAVMDGEETAKKRKHLPFKTSYGLLLALLTLIIVVNGLGNYLFARGFLLTKLVLDHKSNCSLPPIALHGSHQPGSVLEGCWHPKTFNKAVIIVIDALRYDFTVPFLPNYKDQLPQNFHNSIPFLYDTVIAQPNHAFLLPFIADPPTTTLQRLKGLTTGTLPTFIDAGSNFAGTAIEEDNLVAQLRTAGKNIVHLGDDTWHSLFPGYFDVELTRPYHSFQTWDLHTVDDGVSEYLLPLLHPSNSSKWDILFGHYLGVDHAGHTYGPDHPAMTAKLHQMDNILRQVVPLIENDTLLVVMGDHGMDAKGDHGGESDNEVEAALWMYSKKGAFGRSLQEFAKPPATAKERPVNQIDLVSTLALLLGLPIPFNNLGKPIEEAFIGASNYENLALVNRLAAAQIQTYQEEYALVRKPDLAATAKPTTLWNAAREAWDQQLHTGSKPTPEQWESLASAFSQYQQHNLDVCKTLWARFDLLSMAQGIAVLFFTLAILIIYARGQKGYSIDINTALLSRGTLGMLFGAVIGYGLLFALPIVAPLPTAVFSAAVASCLTIGIVLWSVRSQLISPLPRTLWSWVCVLATLLPSIGFASNSYTIWEDEILLFFLATFGVLMLARSFRLATSRDRMSALYHSAVFMVLVRLASLSRLCREEQMPYCKSTYYASATFAPWHVAIPYIIALVLPSAIKSYYESTASYHGSAPFWIGIAFRTSLFLIAAYWTLDAVDDGDWFNVTLVDLKAVRMSIAQVILAIAIGAGTATFAYQAPLIDVEAFAPEFKPGSSPQSSAKYSKANGFALPSLTPIDQRPKLIIHGTTNLYGSHFAMLPFTILLIPLLLLQKPMGQATLVLTTIAILSLLELLHLLHQPQHHPPQVTTPPSTTTSPLGPTILALLAHFLFFKTGHQAALSSIQWNAAFIPLRTIHYPWSPILMLLNTFAGQILCATALPLVVLWRRPFLLSPAFTGTSITPASSASFAASAEGQRQLAEARERDRERLVTDLGRAMATHVLVYATINVATTVWAAHLRRHLMLYRVFCPRWMLGVSGMLVAEVVGVAIGLGAVRWTVGSVAGVFGW